MELFTQPTFAIYGYTEQQAYAFDKNFVDLNNTNITISFETDTVFNTTSLFYNGKTQFTNIAVSGTV